MALNRLDRKAELVRRGLTQAKIAEAVGCSDVQVSKVLNEQNLESAGALAVMRYVAEQIGLEIEEVFPVEKVEAYRRKELVG
jgi:transcriptional regulator with XRE-family HTH domain